MGDPAEDGAAVGDLGQRGLLGLGAGPHADGPPRPRPGDLRPPASTSVTPAAGGPQHRGLHLRPQVVRRSDGRAGHQSAARHAQALAGDPRARRHARGCADTSN